MGTVLAGGKYCVMLIGRALWKQAVSKNGSSHAMLLATDLIPQSLSHFERRLAEDADGPNPWRQVEFAAGTLFHFPHSIVLLCSHGVAGQSGKSWPGQSRCLRS